MKFTCAKETLERIITAAERFTGKNLQLPILGNILFEAEKNTIRVIATNLEYGIRAHVSGKVSREGKISVPAKVISSLIQSTGEELVDFEGKQNNLVVKTETRETKVNGVPTEDFPLLPKIKKTSFFTVDSSELRRGIEQVLPAASTSEFKPELNGLFFRVTSRTLSIAATDTFRLAEYTAPLPKKNVSDSFSFIMPSRVAQEIARLLGTEGEEAVIAVGENQIMCELDGVVVVSRLIEGKFPDYAGIIPKSHETTTFVNRDALISAVRSSSIFSSKLQDVTVTFTGKEIGVASMNQEVGEYKTRLPASTTGSSVKVNFNYRYLLDGLSSINDEEIFIGCNTETTPALLRSKTSEDFLYVLMPIRFT